jgi:hypothetical protein
VAWAYARSSAFQSNRPVSTSKARRGCPGSRA